jgi:hypothetical protein
MCRGQTAGRGWAALDRDSAWRGAGRSARVAADRCGWLAVVVLYRRGFAAQSIDCHDLRPARFDHRLREQKRQLGQITDSCSSGNVYFCLTKHLAKMNLAIKPLP